MSAATRVYRVGPSPFYRIGTSKLYDPHAVEGDLFLVRSTSRPDSDGDLSGVVARGEQADSLSPECLVELTPGDRPVVDVEDLEDVVAALGGDRAAVRGAVNAARLIASARR